MRYQHEILTPSRKLQADQSLLLQFFNLRPFNPLKTQKTAKKIAKLRILKKVTNEKFLLSKTDHQKWCLFLDWIKTVGDPQESVQQF